MNAFIYLVKNFLKIIKHFCVCLVLLISYFVFVRFFFFETDSCYVAHAGLHLTIFFLSSSVLGLRQAKMTIPNLQNTYYLVRSTLDRGESKLKEVSYCMHGIFT